MVNLFSPRDKLPEFTIIDIKFTNLLFFFCVCVLAVYVQTCNQIGEETNYSSTFLYISSPGENRHVRVDYIVDIGL